MMKLLGHHVALPAIMLALIDAGLFLGALYALGFAGTCNSCYLHSVTHLRAYEAALLTLVFVAITAAVGLYNRDSLLDFRVFLKRFLLASQFVLIPAVSYIAIAKVVAGLPFGWFMGILSIAIAMFFVVLFLVRVTLLWVFDLSFLKRRILVLGDTDESEAVVDFIRRHGTSHLRCVGHLRSLRIAQDIQEVAMTQGNVALQALTEQALTQVAAVELPQIAKAMRAEEVVIAVQDKRGLPMWQLLECKLQGLLVTDYLTFWERETGKLDLSRVGPGWLAFSDGFCLNWPRRVMKRIVDFMAAAILLALTLPIALIVALLIKLDSPGPVIYKQQRVGKDGQLFRIWKFRSMFIDAESAGPCWAAERDHRVTRVGRVIRRLRIDELPQIINVLKGDMSFIGPRPEQIKFVEQLRKELPLYDLRHRVQPGITGWAQVNYRYGASVEDAKHKLAYDLYYAKNHDTVLDIFILLQTVRVILFAHGSR